MKMNFIIYLLLVFSCSSAKHETGNDYKATTQHQQYIKEIERIGYVLDKYNFLSFSTSEINSNTGEWYKYLTFFSQKNNLSEQVISKTDLSDGFYGDTLLFYKNNTTNKQVIIWKQKGEYYSFINVYLFEKDNLIFVGDLCVGSDCTNCDVYNFPESQIEIKETETGEELKVEFKGQTTYRGSISQGTPYNSVNIKTDRLTLLYQKIGSKICY